MHKPNIVSDPYGPNLLLNPGFEIDGTTTLFQNWAQKGGATTVTKETSDVHTGAQAAKIRNTLNDPYYRQYVTVTANTNYQFAVWCHRAAGNTGSPRYRIFDNTNSANIIAGTATGVTATVYTYYSVNFTTPAGCVSVRLDLIASSTTTDDSWFDDVEIKQIL